MRKVIVDEYVNAAYDPLASFNNADKTVAVYRNLQLDSELKKLCESGVKKLQVRGGGLAPALIHRSVFEKMEYPYFKWTDYKSRAQLSEDLYFCEKFKSIKIPIFVDTRVACGHLMRHIDYI